MKTILVVDDNRAVRTLLKECLEDFGFHVDVFEDEGGFVWIGVHFG